MKKSRSNRSSASSLLQMAAGLARGADRILTALVASLLILVFVYACFSLWDTWRIYNGASIDESLLKYKPELNHDNTESFEELMKINSDVCAWLTIEDTHIDYPIVRGKDNVTYVNTDVYGEFSLSGSIFLDYRNSRDFTDSYSLIYGHHMEGEVMFGELDYFMEDQYFKEHPKGILYLPDRTFQITFFSCLQADAYDTQFFNPGKWKESEVDLFLEQVQATSLQYREIGVTNKDRIVALSTCSDSSTNARTLLIGCLEEISDQERGEEGE